MLYATDDAGAIFLAEHGDALRDAFAFPRPPADLPRRLAGKYSMFQLCRDLGVPTPQAMLAWSPGEAAEFAGQAGFPLIAKLATPWRGTAHAGQRLRSTTIIRTLAQLREVCARADETGTGLMLQEYIPPAPGQDWFFHGYFDASGRCAPAFTGVKDRSYPAYAGLTSLGRAVPNSRVAGQVSAMAAAIGFRGIADLDLRFDPRDAQYKLLDFNPRLGAQFRLFTTDTGLDVARAAYLDLTGQPAAAGEMTRDRRFLVENYDPLGAAGYWRRGELGLRSWAASLRRVDEFAWLARDDLRPFGLMCARMAWRGVTRRFSAGQSGAGQSSARGPSVLLRAAGGPRYRPGPRARVAHPGNHEMQYTGGESMNGTTDVAIVGAGPYGLSVAAHLRRSGLSIRQFGLPMHLWRACMPRGMFLKSQGFASNLSDPAGQLTLAAFCRATGRPYADYGLPVPLDTFVAYGQWFQSSAGLDVEEVLVTGVSPAAEGYELTLTGGETLRARQVVVAVGVEHFAYLPGELAGLPATACTHSSAHTDLAAFAGQRVIVVGAGQSALESAALLHEHGAQVQIVMREQKVVWNGAPLAPRRPLLQRLREPEAGLGSGWGTWFYSTQPGMFRHLPEGSRVQRARTKLGPAGASWLRGRVEGEFPILTGHTLDWAASGPGGVRLGLVPRLGRQHGGDR